MTSSLKQLREKIAPEWSEDREAALLLALSEPPAKTYRRRILLPIAVVVPALAAAALLLFYRADDLNMPTTTAAPIVASTTVTLADGSMFHPEQGSDVVVAASAPERTVVIVRSGGARFDILSDPNREFSVESASVSIHVMRAEFQVSRREDEVAIEVIRGTLFIRWPGGETELKAGERGVYPPTNATDWALDGGYSQENSADAGIVLGAPNDVKPKKPKVVDTGRRRAQEWEILASNKSWNAAYKLLTKPGAVVRDRAGVLFLAADCARNAKDQTRAAVYLRRLITGHSKDRRSALAAFILGKIELARGRPGAAAKVFAKVQKLSPNRSLSEHALVREIKALAKDHQLERSRKRANEYLRKYPRGTWYDVVAPHR